MSPRRTPLPFLSTDGDSPLRYSSFYVSLVLVGLATLAAPGSIFAQRGGGGGGGGAGGGRNSIPVICVYDCPSPKEGLSTQDDLKNFRRVMAMQATPEQRAAFVKIVQYTESAGDQLQAFRDSLQKVPASSLQSSLATSDRATPEGTDEAIEKARAANQNFLNSLSPAQKSGLKDALAELAKADSDLDKEIKNLDQTAKAPKPDNEATTASAVALDKALTSFQSRQFTLGGEMSILFPTGQGIAFSLPAQTNSMTIAGQPISVAASGAVTRTSSENGHNIFSLKIVADLSDLQQNITAILRSQLNRDSRCGERLEIQDATLIPQAPSTVIMTHLHFERWICPAGSSQQNAVELAAGDGEIEIKLTPSVDQTSGQRSTLTLASAITRVEANGLLRDLLRSGDLGVTLRDQIAASLLTALQKAVDLKATLPPPANESATVQKAQFDDAGADQLNLIIDGQLQFSDEQTKQFAAQLKQQLSAQRTTPP